MKKIILLGSKPTFDIALRILKKKFKNKIFLSCVVTNKRIFENNFSNHKYKPHFISDSKGNEKKIISVIKKKKLDFLFSVQHKWIFSRNLLSILENSLNLHNAKLPDYKGFFSINHAIANGDKNYTSTIHWINNDVDGGNIAYKKTIKIETNETATSLYNKTLKSCEIIITNLFNGMLKNNIPSKRIRGKGKFYSKNSLESLKEINLNTNCNKIDNIVRACFFPPHEPAFFIKEKKKFYIIPKKQFNKF
tara:strand:- start:478 stop:1224 length:747 start_codon:yes stop_codon:yes gene_type:complete